MIAKVVLGTMQNARKLVSIVEAIPYDAELCAGRYVVNAKSMLGVLSMPDFETGELHVHTDNAKECEEILFKLLEAGLLMDTNDAVCRSIYDITTFGEILIDFTSQGKNEDGQMLYARNPGGAPANVAVAAGRLGAHTAFIGKAGNDMQGKFLRSVLEKENAVVWNKCKEKKCHLIGAMKTNRILYPNGVRTSASDYASILTQDQFHLVTVKGREYYVHRYQGHLNKIDQAVVLLTYPKEAFGVCTALKVFLCSDLSLSDVEVLEHYSHRWKIEIMFKQQKSIWA